MKKSILLSLLFAFSMALFAQNKSNDIFSVEAGGTYYYSINDNDLKTGHYSGDLLFSTYFTPRLKLSLGFSYAVENFKRNDTQFNITHKETTSIYYYDVPILLLSVKLINRPKFGFALFGGAVFKHASKFKTVKTIDNPHYENNTTEKLRDNSILKWTFGWTFIFPLNRDFALNISSGIRIPHSYNSDVFGDSSIPNGDNIYVDKWDICIAGNCIFMKNKLLKIFLIETSQVSKTCEV